MMPTVIVARSNVTDKWGVGTLRFCSAREERVAMVMPGGFFSPFFFFFSSLFPSLGLNRSLAGCWGDLLAPKWATVQESGRNTAAVSSMSLALIYDMCSPGRGVNQSWANTGAAQKQLACLASSSEGICGKLLKDLTPLLMKKE